MKSFITAYRKAKLNRFRLIYDANNNRYLITKHKHWQTWQKHALIINFDK